MKYKKWTLAEKLEILSSGNAIGIVESWRKYGVSTGTYYNWKKKHDSQGEAGLKGKITPVEKWNKDKHLILRKDLAA